MSATAQASGPIPRSAILVGSLLVALVLNVLLVHGILLLNRSAAARAPRSDARLQARLLDLPPDERQIRAEALDEPEPREALMQVDLDLSTPPVAPTELPELSFDLQLPYPAIGAAGVFVATRVSVHKRGTAASAPTEPSGDGPMDSNVVDQPPRELASSPAPVYPRAAQRRRIEGIVAIELLIDVSGRVRDSRDPMGDALLVKAVRDVLPDLRFAPAMHRGRAVSVWGRKTFRFQLPPRR